MTLRAASARARLFVRARRILVIAVLMVVSCGRGHPPNLVLVTVDSLRPDRLSCYGYTDGHTPHIDSLAARGALFQRAFTDAASTSPAIASTLTGLFAVHHGLHSSQHSLGRMTTLATVLRGHGFSTAAVVGSRAAGSAFGFSQGFQSYDEGHPQGDADPTTAAPDVADDSAARRPPPASLRTHRPDTEVGDRAIAWLESSPQKPFFLWVQFFGPHDRSYPDLSIEDLLRRQITEYDLDLASTDVQIGRLLETLRRLALEDDTLLVLHSDHGQNLFERFYVGHGRDLHDPTLAVPLIVAGPGVAAGARTNAFARNVDILPTVLDLLGLPAPAGIDGRSLALAARYPWLARLTGASDGETYAEATVTDDLFSAESAAGGQLYRFGFLHRALRTKRWKYVEIDAIPQSVADPALPPALIERYRQRALFDLYGDPHEGRDVIDESPEIAAEMRARLRELVSRARRAPARQEATELRDEPRGAP